MFKSQEKKEDNFLGSHMKRKRIVTEATGLLAVALLIAVGLQGRKAEAQIPPPPQMPLAGSAIPKWAEELPIPTVVDARSGNPIELRMTEFKSMVLPAAAVPGYTGTWTWGYLAPGESGTPPRPTYLGPIILAQRGTPNEIKYVNDLGTAAGTNLTFWRTSTDQTLHWADPKKVGHSMKNYDGPIPAVAHLHGGEVPAELDGGPDAWFTSDGTEKGRAYYSEAGAAGNEAIYTYPNTQEAANIWFHDHALGITRLNVYAGLAGAYLLSDPDHLTLPAGLEAYGLGGEPIVPLVIQDRMFDTNGQLYFPNMGINMMEHPFWVPEFVGDAVVVNGKTWPTFGTAGVPKASKRYRFLFLNGSNARTYELFLADPVTKVMGPPMWVIGTDGGYLDAPVKIDPAAAANNKLTIMPGERYDVIIDFSDPAWRAANPGFSGQLILRNTGRTPYPKGAAPQGSTLGQILKLFIGPPVTDAGYNPASGTPIRPAGNVIPRLVNPTTGTQVVIPQKVRQLTLNEVMAMGGPIEILVNNTRWDGRSVAQGGTTPPTSFIAADGTRTDFDPTAAYNFVYSETPQEGETELWEIVNLTADAHPIHLHLVQFQLMNRQNFSVSKYNVVYNALFPASSAIDPMTGLPYPGGVFIGGFGPPLHYGTGNPLALGGNPDVARFLQGRVQPPLPQEAGWKDTVIMNPGQVTRIMVRWAPTDLPATTSPAAAYFPFDPSSWFGYVWHCHIIDHEDNEMMRPDMVKANPSAVRK
jgi:FtsP/CotA-like multicopper oxidase with cupredoxin domain